MEDQQLEPKTPQPLAKVTALPRGFEEPIEKEDLIIPRAQLVQPTTPELLEGKVKLGTIVNSLTLEELPAVFIPVFKFTSWARFNPRKKDDPNFDPAYDPGKLIWKATDPDDERVIAQSKFGPDGEPPLATKFLQFLSFFPGHESPIVVQFSKTSYKAGKKLLNLALHTKRDMFAFCYKLTTTQEKNDQGTYFVLGVEPAGPVTPEDYAVAEEFYNSYAEKPLKVHEETVDETTDPE